MKTLEDLQLECQDGDPVSVPPGTPGTVQFLGPVNHSVMVNGMNVCFRGGQFTTDNDELIQRLRGITRRNVGISEVQAVVTEAGTVEAVVQPTGDVGTEVVKAVATRTASTAEQVVKGEQASARASGGVRPEVAAALAAKAGNAPQIS